MYHAHATLATVSRILNQLSHDHRTLVLIFIVPCILLGLLRWLFDGDVPMFNRSAPVLLGVFPFVVMFVVTSITTLRERITGTMERLMSLPIGRLDLLLGYMIAFGILAIIQALLASVVLIYVLGLDIQGPDWFITVTALLGALLGTALGLLLSAFARTEFQAVQFMPAFVLPQVLIGGLILPLDQMPDTLQVIAHWLPLTYLIDALNLAVLHDILPWEAWWDLWVVGFFIIGALLFGGMTLRRRVD